MDLAIIWNASNCDLYDRKIIKWIFTSRFPITDEQKKTFQL